MNPGELPSVGGSDGGPPRAGLRGLARDLVSFDRRALAVLVYVPIALTLLEYVFVPPVPTKRPPPPWVGELLRSAAARWPSVPRSLWDYLWWEAGCLTLLLLVPLAWGRVVGGLTPSRTGLRVRGTLRDAPTYGLLFLAFAPVVWWVAQRADFRATYPFYRPVGRASGADFLAFEAGYALQFLGVEYFFRGFLTLGLKPVLGRASVLVMLAPYCMIHFHKPMLEALGAIGAGAVLGCLSWRTGTVLYGWALHYGVALSMDLLSLHASGRL